MSGSVRWCDDIVGAAITCRVCASTGVSAHVAVVEVGWRPPFDVLRCGACGSVELLDDPIDSSTTDEQVDQYIEGGVGIGTLADALNEVDPDTVSRFLDVGCNVGFALDLARFAFGWEVVGVEPSLAGRRGAAELGLDIRHEYLDERSSLGAPFDLVLASEVIEHVLDPLGFARVLAAQLAPGGRLLLTTPAAEHVVRSSSEAEVLVALSPGLHVFLASAAGLEQLLRRAGFGAVRVERRRGTLCVCAAIDRDDPLEPGQGRIDAPTLERYYAGRARTAALDSALANGMATRFVRSAVSRGDFATADQLTALMTDAICARHDLDLDAPTAVVAGVRDGRPAPWHLANVAFALGMTALLRDDDPRRAAELFELTVEATTSWHRQAGILDLDSADLAVQGAIHRALALARVGLGAAAVPAAVDLDVLARLTPGRAAALATAQCRVFVDLVARGSYVAAAELSALVARRVGELADGPDGPDGPDAVIVLDTTFSLGILRLNTGAPQDAVTWFVRCQQLAARRDDDHAAHLVAQSRAHLTLAERAGAIVATVADGWPHRPDVHHQVDVYWTDPAGTFLEGWAHIGPETIRSIAVRIGDRAVVAPPRPTPDLLQYWPDVPEVASAGFTAYVPGSPHEPVSLLLTTDRSEVEVALPLPDHQLPDLAAFEPLRAVTARIEKLIADAPPGPILALGIRSSSAEVLAAQTDTFGDRQFVGFDIHPGLGVDVVGDAHRLAELLPHEHFAVVFSTSVLEHVAMPWLVAAGCAAVLQTGGLAIHVAPWAWPVHSQPNDFWRMSAGGLRQLFGPATGFRPVDGGDINTAVILPVGPWRAGALRMPTTSTPASSWIAAEKIDDRARELRWTYDADDGGDAARSYPLEALAPEVPAQGWPG